MDAQAEPEPGPVPAWVDDLQERGVWLTGDQLAPPISVPFLRGGANADSANPQSAEPRLRLRPRLLVQAHGARPRSAVVVPRQVLRPTPQVGAARVKTGASLQYLSRRQRGKNDIVNTL